MKYLISESQIKNVISNYLDNHFIIKRTNQRIYFVSSDDDEYAQITFLTENGYCFINYELVLEIMNLFSQNSPYSMYYICQWVEKTLDVDRVIGQYVLYLENSHLDIRY